MDVMTWLRDIGELYKLDDYRTAMFKLEEFLASIPDPKAEMPNSYLVIEYAARLLLNTGDLERAWHWAVLAPKHNTGRQHLGEAEFLVGRVAFEKGDLDLAATYFGVADKKSRGRIFRGEDPKYKALLRE